METRIYEDALKLFVSTDPDRPLMHQPFRQNNYWIATDAFAMVLLPTSAAPYLDYEPQTKPDCFRVVDQVEIVGAVEMSVHEILMQLKGDIAVDPPKFCIECKGSGTVEFQYRANTGGYYDVEADCPVCEVSGAYSVDLKIKRRPHILLGTPFQHSALKRLLDLAALLGVDVIAKVGGTPEKANLFQIGSAKVLVMPCVIDKDVEVVNIQIASAE